MNDRNVLFEKYNETRTAFLDPDDTEKALWFDNHFEKIYKQYLESIDKKAKILELGSNRGFLLSTLYKNGYKNLTGVDLSKDDVAAAKNIIPEAELYCEDVFDFLERSPCSFDVIILKALIEHIKKEKMLYFLELIEKSLTENGMVLIDVHNLDWVFSFHDRYVDFTHEVGFTKESLRQIMVLYFDNVKVVPTQSAFIDVPIGRVERMKRYLARKIFFGLAKWAEPESFSIKERLLIGLGNKKKRGKQ